MRVGVEVGGTFTDLVAVGNGGITITKVPSTPHSPDIGALNGIKAAGLSLESVTDLAHGSTVATNAVLERKGAKVAFVTTEGFRDILFLQRHDRRSIYDIKYRKPEPVMARRDCFEASERVLADGSIATPLDEKAVREVLIPKLKEGNYGAVAVCLLNGYANPVHENRLVEMIEAALPDLLVTRSSEISHSRSSERKRNAGPVANDTSHPYTSAGRVPERTSAARVARAESTPTSLLSSLARLTHPGGAPPTPCAIPTGPRRRGRPRPRPPRPAGRPGGTRVPRR